MRKNNNKKANDNNPTSDTYWQLRGYKKRPENWKKLIPKESKRTKKRDLDNIYDGRGFNVDSMFDPLCSDDY